MKRIFAFALAITCAFAAGETSESPAPKVRVEVRTDQKAVDFHETAPEPRPVPRTLAAAVDELSPADLKALITTLREHYLAPEKLDDVAVSRATAQGLFERFSPGVVLPFGPAAEAETDSPFRAELIEDRVGYIRFGSLTEERLADLDAALKNFNERSLKSAILDLRATPAGSQFTIAAKICERFSPKGRVLFTVRRPSTRDESVITSKQEPTFSKVIVTLVDADTAGAAEVIAAVLRTQAKALVIGRQTRGEAVEYEKVTLPSGRHLRIAVAEVALPENILVFPGGVTPDVAVDVSPEETEKVLKAELEGGLGPLINETERVRMNEAALVAGTNPELEAARIAAASRGKKPEPPLRDAVLQRALDAITTISLFEQAPPKGSR
jgi:Peptidase family S41